MSKIKLLIIVPVMLIMALSLVLSACAGPAAPAGAELRIGWTADLSGPTASSSVRHLPMWQASVRYANEVEGGINGYPVKLLWWDDKYTVPGALASWEAAKAANVHTFKIMSSSSAVALHDPLAEYKMGTISQASHPVALIKPTTLFTFYALGSDAAGAFLDWALDDWKARGKTGKPKVAVFTYEVSKIETNIKSVDLA